MRIKINFSNNTEKVPNNMSVVNSFIHRCLGTNNGYHDKPSDYCTTKLMNGSVVDGGKYLNFNNNGFIIISSPYSDFINKIAAAIVINGINIGYGMNFIGIDNINDKIYDGYNYFKTTENGILLKNRDYNKGDDFKTKYINFDNPNYVDLLKEHTIKKFSKINPKLDFSGFDIKLNVNNKSKIQKVMVNETPNFSSVLQLTLYGNKKLIKTIYDYGLGQSTGSGFGLVYNTKNHALWYKNTSLR